MTSQWLKRCLRQNALLETSLTDGFAIALVPRSRVTFLALNSRKNVYVRVCHTGKYCGFLQIIIFGCGAFCTFTQFPGSVLEVEHPSNAAALLEAVRRDPSHGGGCNDSIPRKTQLGG